MSRTIAVAIAQSSCFIHMLSRFLVSSVPYSLAAIAPAIQYLESEPTRRGGLSSRLSSIPSAVATSCLTITFLKFAHWTVVCHWHIQQSTS